MIIMKTKSPVAIRVSVTPEVSRALEQAKKRFPALSDPEILKLGLSQIAAEANNRVATEDIEEIRLMAADSFGYDYLNDPEEDIYHEGMGTKVNFR